MSLRVSSRASVAVLLVALGLVTARGMSIGLAQATPAATSGTAGPTFPMQVVSGIGDGPALFMGAADESPAVGYLSAGVVFELVEPPTTSRVLVRIRGGMRVRAYLDASRIAARIERRGRIRGTPAYVGGGDFVRVLGFDPDGRARVSAHVVIGSRAFDYTGTYPAVGLGADVPDETPDTTPPGTFAVVHAIAPVRVYDREGGTLLETLPAGEIPCRLMAPEGNGYTVLLGTGPYLAGYIAERPIGAPSPTATFTRPSMDPVPARLRSQENFPLVHLATGTRISFEAQVLAILDQPGLARVIARHEDTGEADVFVAVDSSVAVRGMVPIDALGAAVE